MYHHNRDVCIIESYVTCTVTCNNIVLAQRMQLKYVTRSYYATNKTNKIVTDIFAAFVINILFQVTVHNNLNYRTYCYMLMNITKSYVICLFRKIVFNRNLDGGKSISMFIPLGRIPSLRTVRSGL